MSKDQAYEKMARKLGIPKAISTVQEYNRALAIIEDLMEKGESISDAEADLLKTWVRLVDFYEDEISPPKTVSAATMIEFLMDQRGLKNVDLVPDVFNHASHASEVISGKK